MTDWPYRCAKSDAGLVRTVLYLGAVAAFGCSADEARRVYCDARDSSTRQLRCWFSNVAVGRHGWATRNWEHRPPGSPPSSNPKYEGCTGANPLLLCWLRHICAELGERRSRSKAANRHQYC